METEGKFLLKKGKKKSRSDNNKSHLFWGTGFTFRIKIISKYSGGFRGVFPLIINGLEISSFLDCELHLNVR